VCVYIYIYIHTHTLVCYNTLPGSNSHDDVTIGVVRLCGGVLIGYALMYSLHVGDSQICALVVSSRTYVQEAEIYG